ncbi:MAG: hypothetical protein EOQ34_30360, partial [Mesorhizobium sp.]
MAPSSALSSSSRLRSPAAGLAGSTAATGGTGADAEGDGLGSRRFRFPRRHVVEIEFEIVSEDLFSRSLVTGDRFRIDSRAFRLLGKRVTEAELEIVFEDLIGYSSVIGLGIEGG